MKPNFALSLPVLQVAISSFLVKWGKELSLRFGLVDSPLGNLQDLWNALNAPGLVFRYFGVLLSSAKWIPDGFLGVQTDTLLYLSGVALLWYCVGRQVDRHIFRTRPFQWQVPALAFVFNLFLILWGLRLLISALELFSRSNWQNYHRPSDTVNGSIVLIWSLVLIAFGTNHVKTFVNTTISKSGT